MRNLSVSSDGVVELALKQSNQQVDFVQFGLVYTYVDLSKDGLARRLGSSGSLGKEGITVVVGGGLSDRLVSRVPKSLEGVGEVHQSYLEVGESGPDGVRETCRRELAPLAHESLEGAVDVGLQSVGDVCHDGGGVGFVDCWARVGIVGGSLNLRLEILGTLLDWKSGEEAAVVGVHAAAERSDAVVDGVQV
jgi:hypothetical protein